MQADIANFFCCYAQEKVLRVPYQIVVLLLLLEKLRKYNKVLHKCKNEWETNRMPKFKLECICWGFCSCLISLLWFYIWIAHDVTCGAFFSRLKEIFCFINLLPNDRKSILFLFFGTILSFFFPCLISFSLSFF